MPPFSCSMSPQESPTRMSPSGTRTSPGSAITFPLSSSETRSTKKTEESKPDKSLSTESAISNTSTSQPNLTTSMRSHFFGSSELLREIPTSIWLRPLLSSLKKSPWTKPKSKPSLRNGRLRRTLLFQTRKTRTSNDIIIIYVLDHLLFNRIIKEKDSNHRLVRSFILKFIRFCT